MTKLAPIAGALALLSASPALALQSGPLTAEFSVEIENDTVVDAANPASEISDTYATTEAAITMSISAASSLNLALTFESIIDVTSTGAKYGAVGIAAPFGPVTVSGVYSSRNVAGARIDHLATLIGEMDLATNPLASLGYRYGRDGPSKTTGEVS